MRVHHIPSIFSYTGVSVFDIVLGYVRLVFMRLRGVTEVVREVHGSAMVLDLKTPGISKTLFVYGTREILDTFVMQQEVEQGTHVLDIGGNIGYYTLLAASLVGEKGRVSAFEPDPRNIRVLKMNVERNDLSSRVTIYPYAAGAVSGTATFHLAERSNLSTFVEGAAGRPLEVQVMPVDDFKDVADVRYMRMDIEGYESKVIDGAKAFLAQGTPLKLQIEVHPAAYKQEGLHFQDRLEELGRMGFEVRYLISASTAQPKAIAEKGYAPVKTVKEGRWGHGLYEGVLMEDLISFLNEKEKVVRSVLLERV